MKQYIFTILILCTGLVVTPPTTGREPIPPGAIMTKATPEAIMTAHQVEWISPREDMQLQGVEKSERIFKRLNNPMINITSYFHQRKIGEAIVEKDFIRYQFNATTGEILEKTKKWRKGLPKTVTAVIPGAEAESMVEGMIHSSTLMFISPDSEIFHFTPVPENPCWIVRSITDGWQVITVIDAITGKILGNGVPPPAQGLSIHGPNWGDCPQDAYWYYHANHARFWFETMGYATDQVGNASEATVSSHIQSDTTVMFYELDHGSSTEFHNRCDQDIFAVEIESWIASYTSMGFSFIGSCGGMCSTGENTFATEFRKGENTDSTVIGYCCMDCIVCDDCWIDAIAWQEELFSRMDQGYTIGSAYAYANAAYPGCANDGHNCMRIAGDINLVFGGSTYPRVKRSFAGSIYDLYNGLTYISPFSAVASLYYTRAHHIRGNSNVPPGQFLTVSASTSYPYNEIAFANDSVLTANGPFTATTGTGTRVSFVSATDKNQGLEMRPTAELKILNGGQIKIYE